MTKDKLRSSVRAEFSAAGYRFALIVSRYNQEISEKLLEGSLRALHQTGATDENIRIFYVPGSFELPQAAKKIAELDRFDALICIGAIIRGETLHFELISQECAHGIQETAGKTGVPISFGVITANTREQALERSRPDDSNKGWEAAMAAIEMANLYANIR